MLRITNNLAQGAKQPRMRDATLTPTSSDRENSSKPAKRKYDFSGTMSPLRDLNAAAKKHDPAANIEAANAIQAESPQFKRIKSEASTPPILNDQPAPAFVGGIAREPSPLPRFLDLSDKCNLSPALKIMLSTQPGLQILVHDNTAGECIVCESETRITCGHLECNYCRICTGEQWAPFTSCEDCKDYEFCFCCMYSNDEDEQSDSIADDIAGDDDLSDTNSLASDIDFDATSVPSDGSSMVAHGRSTRSPSVPLFPKDYRVTYSANIECGADKLQVPIDAKDVAGKEKDIINKEFKKVWKWSQVTVPGAKVNLGDAYELAKSIHDDDNDSHDEAEKPGNKSRHPTLLPRVAQRKVFSFSPASRTTESPAPRSTPGSPQEPPYKQKEFGRPPAHAEPLLRRQCACVGLLHQWPCANNNDRLMGR